MVPFFPRNVKFLKTWKRRTETSHSGRFRFIFYNGINTDAFQPIDHQLNDNKGARENFT